MWGRRWHPPLPHPMHSTAKAGKHIPQVPLVDTPPAEEKHPAWHTEPCPVSEQRELCPWRCPALPIQGDPGCVTACPSASSTAASHEEWGKKTYLFTWDQSLDVCLFLFFFFNSMNSPYFFLDASCQWEQRRRETRYNQCVSKIHPLPSENP